MVTISRFNTTKGKAWQDFLLKTKHRKLYHSSKENSKQDLSDIAGFIWSDRDYAFFIIDINFSYSVSVGAFTPNLSILKIEFILRAFIFN